jgi:peroxiredoxin family protein
MSMDVLEIGTDKMISAATAPVGVATMLEDATHSKATLFI